jgi:hypothetical protein
MKTLEWLETVAGHELKRKLKVKGERHVESKVIS